MTQAIVKMRPAVKPPEPPKPHKDQGGQPSASDVKHKKGRSGKDGGPQDDHRADEEFCCGGREIL